jgi:hypothetical protein
MVQVHSDCDPASCGQAVAAAAAAAAAAVVP